MESRKPPPSGPAAWSIPEQTLLEAASGPPSLTRPPARAVSGCHPQWLCGPTHRLTARLHCPAVRLTPVSARPRRAAMGSRRGGVSRWSPGRRRMPQRPLPSLRRARGGRGGEEEGRRGGGGKRPRPGHTGFPGGRGHWKPASGSAVLGFSN